MKALVVHPGASWATHDVYAGVVEGLRAASFPCAEWRLDGRLDRWNDFLHYLWRKQKKSQPVTAWPKPSHGDVLHFATTGLIERALERHCSDLIVVSAMFLPANKIDLAKRAGLRVWLLCTESPYDSQHELRLAAMVDGVWTHERAMLETFRAVNPRTAYLPHAWRPGVHDVTTPAAVAASDVLFCGSFFKERIAWFESIDWTGIDLALYGTTELIPKRSRLRQYIRGGMIPNQMLPGLAQRSQVQINFFRTVPTGYAAESLNPRLYELAAGRCCVVTDARAEVTEKFGASMPTFTTPQEASALVRALVADPGRRAACAAGAYTAVQGETWHARAQQMIADLQRWTAQGEQHGEVSRQSGRNVSGGGEWFSRDQCDKSHAVVGGH